MNYLIQDDELLARFIPTKRWIRKIDNTIKSDAFIPYSEPQEVSITRHNNLSENELWDIGALVVDKIRISQNNPAIKLYGRGDIPVLFVKKEKLTVKADPTERNPNHCVICDWPGTKDKHKQIALELAKNAKYISKP